MFGIVFNTRCEKYDCIEDAFDDYRDALDAADRKVVISPYLLEKAADDFDFIKENDIDNTYSVDAFNNLVLELCRNAYNAQRYAIPFPDNLILK